MDNLRKRNIIVRDAFVKEKVNIKTHMWDWAHTSYNIMESKHECPNACKYCYVKSINIRFTAGAILNGTIYK